MLLFGTKILKGKKLIFRLIFPLLVVGKFRGRYSHLQFRLKSRFERSGCDLDLSHFCDCLSSFGSERISKDFFVMMMSGHEILD